MWACVLLLPAVSGHHGVVAWAPSAVVDSGLGHRKEATFATQRKRRAGHGWGLRRGGCIAWPEWKERRKRVAVTRRGGAVGLKTVVQETALNRVCGLRTRL